MNAVQTLINNIFGFNTNSVDVTVGIETPDLATLFDYDPADPTTNDWYLLLIELRNEAEAVGDWDYYFWADRQIIAFDMEAFILSTPVPLPSGLL